MTIHTVEQGTPEWFALRKGRMTASHAQEIGNNGKGLDTYILNLAAAYFSSGEQEVYSNAHTERGNELEGQARAIYELEHGVQVEQVGFVEIDEYVGCSPDGFIGEDGGIEIKCHDDKKHFELAIGGSIDTKYLWQIQMNMFCTGRDWWDYVAYNPNFTKSMIVHRIHANTPIGKHAKPFQSLAKGIEKGKKMMDEYKEKYGV